MATITTTEIESLLDRIKYQAADGAPIKGFAIGGEHMAEAAAALSKSEFKHYYSSPAARDQLLTILRGCKDGPELVKTAKEIAQTGIFTNAHLATGSIAAASSVHADPRIQALAGRHQAVAGVIEPRIVVGSELAAEEALIARLKGVSTPEGWTNSRAGKPVGLLETLRDEAAKAEEAMKKAPSVANFDAHQKAKQIYARAQAISGDVTTALTAGDKKIATAIEPLEHALKHRKAHFEGAGKEAANALIGKEYAAINDAIKGHEAGFMTYKAEEAMGRVGTVSNVSAAQGPGAAGEKSWGFWKNLIAKGDEATQAAQREGKPFIMKMGEGGHVSGVKVGVAAAVAALLAMGATSGKGEQQAHRGA